VRVLEDQDNETRRGGAGLTGFLNSRFDIQGLNFHFEPPLGSSGKTKPQAARKNACGARHDNRGAPAREFLQWMHPERAQVSPWIEITHDSAARAREAIPGIFAWRRWNR